MLRKHLANCMFLLNSHNHKFWVWNVCIYFTLMNDLFQREYQIFKPTDLLVLLHFGVGKDWVNGFPPPPPPNVLTILFIFQSFGLYFSFSLT